MVWEMLIIKAPMPSSYARNGEQFLELLKAYTSYAHESSSGYVVWSYIDI